jgi:hypothetical protein
MGAMKNTQRFVWQEKWPSGKTPKIVAAMTVDHTKEEITFGVSNRLIPRNDDNETMLLQNWLHDILNWMGDAGMPVVFEPLKPGCGNTQRVRLIPSCNWRETVKSILKTVDEYVDYQRRTLPEIPQIPHHTTVTWQEIYGTKVCTGVFLNWVQKGDLLPDGSRPTVEANVMEAANIGAHCNVPMHKIRM